MESPVRILYFSDILCIWAYAAQIRLDELEHQFGDRIEVEERFISIFGSTGQRIGEGWKARGSFDGFSDHIAGVADGFPHVEVTPGLWRECKPRTSMSAHLFIKAVQILETAGELETVPRPGSSRGIAAELTWRIRCAFFAEAVDISRFDILFELADQMKIPRAGMRDLLNNGQAHAALCEDMEQQNRLRLEGSPTFVMDNGRQKLYGNVGYRVLEANVMELLNASGRDQASWC